jgi:glycosyltransferase involved in cell wall biosynthesis
MRILTCIGDATSPDVWSGTPFHLLHAAKPLGFLDAGWRLDPKRLHADRFAWNACRWLRHGESGGYQYSETFLNRLLAQTGRRDSTNNDFEIISHFPLFPPAKDCKRVSYYIDATLAQNFEDYGLAESNAIGRHTIADAMAREKEQYSAAQYIVCMSKWAARSVVERYEISPDKVHIVPAGSNIERPGYDWPKKELPQSLVPVKLGFIGKDWRRKNLSFVLDIAEVLQSRGVQVEVIAAGFALKDGPSHRLLRAVGYIDKRHNPQRFADFVRACHFTCLFSTAEAFGIANRESLRIGIPVLARNVGGIADAVPEGCGHLFATNAVAADVADVIQNYIRDPARYAALCTDIRERAASFAWEAAVEKLMAIWAGSQIHSYAHLETSHA